MSAQFVVIAFYKFVTLKDYQEIKPKLLKKLKDLNILGTILLAEEGINGTVAGPADSIDAIVAYLTSDERLSDLTFKYSYCDEQPFLRTKVKLKQEIVKLAQPDIDPTTCVGQYVKPKAWNDLISQPDVLLIDTRNHYEVSIGTFKHAVDPDIDTFTQLPEFIEKNYDPAKHKRVAMFCTGGIRCEKSTAYMLNHGFEEVYHLEGGILKYLEEIPAEESLWEGECFVFDDRVSVDHQLQRGSYVEGQNGDCLIKNDGTVIPKKQKAHPELVSAPQSAF